MAGKNVIFGSKKPKSDRLLGNILLKFNACDVFKF